MFRSDPLPPPAPMSMPVPAPAPVSVRQTQRRPGCFCVGISGPRRRRRCSRPPLSMKYGRIRSARAGSSALGRHRTATAAVTGTEHQGRQHPDQPGTDQRWADRPDGSDTEMAKAGLRLTSVRQCRCQCVPLSQITTIFGCSRRPGQQESDTANNDHF